MTLIWHKYDFLTLHVFVNDSSAGLFYVKSIWYWFLKSWVLWAYCYLEDNSITLMHHAGVLIIFQ